MVQLAEDWNPGAGGTFRSGALVALDLAAVRADPAHLHPTLILRSGATRVVAGGERDTHSPARHDASITSEVVPTSIAENQTAGRTSGSLCQITPPSRWSMRTLTATMRF